MSRLQHAQAATTATVTPSKVFLVTPDGTKIYASYGAAIRSYYLNQAIGEAMSRGGNGGASAVLELKVNVNGKALVKVMEHCERHHTAQVLPDPGAPVQAEKDDHDEVDDMEPGALLALAGAAHMMNVQPLLGIVMTRCAARLTTGHWEASLFRGEGPSPAPDPAGTADEREFIFTAEPGGADAFGSSWGWGGVAVISVGAPAAADPAETSKPDCWIASQLYGERAVRALLEYVDAATLRRMKAHSAAWRARCRHTLCSEQWRTRQRGLETLNLGSTRQWSDEQRSEAATFVLSLPKLRALSADSLDADLSVLDGATLLDGNLLVKTLSRQSSSILSADTLSVQNEFLALVALWQLANSAIVSEAELGSLYYSGLLPLISVFPTAVASAARRSLVTITLWRCRLPVRDLAGVSTGGASAARSIDLKWKQLNQLDALTVADCLATNQTLEKLDLSWNELDRPGGRVADALAAALSRNRSLKELVVNETSLGDDFGRAMASTLGKNTTLTRLSATYCGLSEDGKAALRQAAARRAQPVELLL